MITNFNPKNDRIDAAILRHTLMEEGFIPLKNDYYNAIKQDTNNIFTEEYTFLIEDINKQIKWLNEPYRFEGIDAPFVPDGVYNELLSNPKLSAYISLYMYHDSIYGVRNDSSWASHIYRMIDRIHFPDKERPYSNIIWNNHENQRENFRKPSMEAVYFIDGDNREITQYEYLVKNKMTLI